MMKVLKTVMKTSISEVMETMFYIPVEFGKDSTLIQSGMGHNQSNMVCELKFSGDFSGCFTLLIPRNLLVQVTENFMGESKENPEEDYLLGTLTEMLNMICGNTLRKVNSKNPFELDIPNVIDKLQVSDTQLFTIIKTAKSKMAIHVELD